MRFMTPDSQIHLLPTPSLLLDERRMMANIERLQDRASALGVALRPHLKTAKSLAVARRVLTGGNGPATVSTLAEAEAFFKGGVQDILYAVGITAQKLERAITLRQKGCDLTIILDSLEQAHEVAQAVLRTGISIPTLIEVDSDGHRGGVLPDAPELIAIGNTLNACGSLHGVLTHAGESYEVSGEQAHAQFAERERSAAVMAAEALRGAGLPCPVVSVGSTPTAHAARDLSGVTELRAGVYMFFDLVQTGIGVCQTDDIAISVLTTVIGHQPQRGWILIDAGWMALSRDRGTASQAIDQGYGLVCNEHGEVFPDIIVALTNQEHGIVTVRPGSNRNLPDIPVGTRLRILPNHACSTASQFDFYDVIPAEAGAEMARWPRFRGW
jgi:D-serine deaminase-like pyridoxal phosphate-dependent protein